MNNDTIRPPAANPPPLLHNPLSYTGMILAAASFFAVTCLIALDFFRGFRNPYLGILTYLIAPAFLITGLTLIAVGALRERFRRRQRPSSPEITLQDTAKDGN